MPLHGVRSAVRRQIRRRRRPLAAVLAALAVAVGLASLDRPSVSANASSVDQGSSRNTIVNGEVAAPILLATTALAQALAVGDVVDIVSINSDERPRATVVSSNARVIDVPSSGGFGASSSSVVVVAIDEVDALNVSAASADGALSVLIRERVPR